MAKTSKSDNSDGTNWRSLVNQQVGIIIGAVGVIIIGYIKIFGDSGEKKLKTLLSKPNMIGTWQLPTGEGNNVKIYEITAAANEGDFSVKDYQEPTSNFVSYGYGNFVSKDSAVVHHTRNYIDRNHKNCTVEVLLCWKLTSPMTFNERTLPTPENMNNEWQCELKTSELIKNGVATFTRKK